MGIGATVALHFAFGDAERPKEEDRWTFVSDAQHFFRSTIWCSYTTENCKRYIVQLEKLIFLVNR